MAAYILSTGSFLPEKKIANSDLFQFPENARALIEAKTGIKSRRHVSEGVNCSDVALEAARNCLAKASIDPKDIDAVLCATSTPDRPIPATATKIAAKLGASKALGFDINSVCSGGLILLSVARAMINGGGCSNILVVAADLYSRILDPYSFSTYPYFGDGAGAALISSKIGEVEILDGCFHSDGSAYDVITLKAGGSELPAHSVENKNDCYFKMDGKRVFAFATTRAPEVIKEEISKIGIGKEEILSVVVHQANVNIIDKISMETGIPRDLFFENLTEYGNTAGASCMIALDECLRFSKFNRSGYIIVAAFGGGLTWGAVSLRINKGK